MSLPLGCLAVLALLLSGCDTIYRTQYHISTAAHTAPAVGQSVGVEEHERRTIRDILSRIAGDLAYIEADEAGTPDIFASYRQNVAHFPMQLRAWTAGRLAVVDVSLFTPGFFWPRAKEYAEVRDRVEADLQAAFGSRVSRVRLGWGEGKRLLDPRPTQGVGVRH